MSNQRIFSVETRGQGLYEFTDGVRRFVSKNGIESGLLSLFVRHTSCSILIQENADPSVQYDLDKFLSKLIPDGGHPSMNWLTHTQEGPDDMPAHIKSALLPTSISIPIMEGELVLGTWQGLYLFEHRRAAMTRQIAAHISG